MIPAYSPQARGRSERNFGTWPGRLPQELRVHGIQSVAGANEFLREPYLAEFNRRFTVPAAQPGHAFIPVRGKNLDFVFSLQHERTVNQDNTVQIGPCLPQIEKTNWRATLAGCRVTVYQYLDGTWSIGYGPHVVGRRNREGLPLQFDALSQQQPLGKRHSPRFPRPYPTPPRPTANQNRTLAMPGARQTAIAALTKRSKQFTIVVPGRSQREIYGGKAEEKPRKNRKRTPSGFQAFQPAGLSRSPAHQPLRKRGSLRSPRFPRPAPTTQPPKPNQNRAHHVL